MKLIEYSPDQFGPMSAAVARKDPSSSLLHRPFVDYYYATRGWCKLYLFCLDDGSVGGTVGVDLLRFEGAGRETTVGFGSNFYSMQPGAGGYLFLQWLRSCRLGLVFGGSEDVHKILRQQKWTYYGGVMTYLLNRAYPPHPGDAAWRTALKWGLQRLRPRLAAYAARLPSEVARNTAVREESSYQEDLLPGRSPFTFRFAPPVDYLAWRYDTRLSFVRYRLFRVLRGGATAGYVVLNDLPDRLLVAHCDGDDPATLAHGVFLSVLEAAREDRVAREAVLTCCHPGMQDVYRRLGFKQSRNERPFVLGSARHRGELPPPDTAGWLINFDIGDNGMRAPFRDQR